MRRYSGFIIFFVIYSGFLLLGYPDQLANPQYLFSVAVLVILTGLLPWLIARPAVAHSGGATQLVLALVVPVVLCAIGFASYFYLFIAPSAPGASVTTVLPRALMPGLGIALVLLLPRFLHAGDPAARR